LQVEDEIVNVRLFRAREAARRASLPGVQRLVELALQKDLAWLVKDLRALARFDPMLAGLISSEELQIDALGNLKRYLLPAELFPVLAEAHFKTAVEQARLRVPGLASQMMDRLGAILPLRREVLLRCAPAPPATVRGRLSDLQQLGAAPKPTRGYVGMAADLDTLLPKHFLETISFEQLPHIPRYLKAMLIRAERALLNPPKDQERLRQLAPYQEVLRQFDVHPRKSSEARRQVEELRWMIEEFKVSLFAQELRTVIPISAKRLDQQLARIGGTG
jgi:ATP-dependent helicase HrpA